MRSCAISERKTAHKSPTGTPSKTEKEVPTTEDKMIYKIPYLGMSAVGFHCVLHNRFKTPTLFSAGVPFQNIYSVIEHTANIAMTAQNRNIYFAVFSITCLIMFLSFYCGIISPIFLMISFPSSEEIN